MTHGYKATLVALAVLVAGTRITLNLPGFALRISGLELVSLLAPTAASVKTLA